MDKKPLLNKELCKKWIDNKNINPITSRKITETGAVFKNLKKQCHKILNINHDKKNDKNDKNDNNDNNDMKKQKKIIITDELCKKWIENKNINPINNKKIRKNGSIYKEFYKHCYEKLNTNEEKAVNKIKKIFTPFINRVSANIIDRINFFIMIRKYIILIQKKNKNICMRLYNFDKKTNLPIYRLGNKIILDKQIGSKSAYGIVYLAHYKYDINYENKYNKLNKFAIKVINYSENNQMEYKILTETTKQVILLNCPHFPITYGLLSCDNKHIKSNYETPIIQKINKVDIANIKNYPDLINNNVSLYFQINELANGDFINFKVNYYNNNIYLSNAIAQIYLSLMFFHKYINAFHNDAHSGNFLYHKIKPGGYFHYNIYGKDYYLENIGFLWVIWDFGLVQPFKNSKLINNNKFGKYKKKIKINSDYFRPISKIIDNYFLFNSNFTKILFEIKKILDKYANNTDISLLPEINNYILNILNKDVSTFTTIKPNNIINKKPYII
jgi:hypothetical protein